MGLTTIEGVIKISKLIYLKDVVTLKLDNDKCIGCGMCTTVCPHAVFELLNDKAVIIDRDACMECGACARNCPVQAIEVRPGVGCAYGIIKGSIQGGDPSCCCSDASDQPCCYRESVLPNFIISLPNKVLQLITDNFRF